MCWSCEVEIVIVDSGENQHVDLNTNVLNVLVFLGDPPNKKKSFCVCVLNVRENKLWWLPTMEEWEQESQMGGR